MKKLYRKGTVHPSPSPSPSPPVSDEFSLSYLPAAVLTLAAALSVEEKEVLAYLLSCSASSAANAVDFSSDHHHNHKTSHKCYCFSCYTIFWARWDSSPNRQLIHDIIDALEHEGFAQGKKKQSANKRDKKKSNQNSKGVEMNANDRRVGNNDGSYDSGRVIQESVHDPDPKGLDGDEETEEKQGSVRKIVSFIGERLWGTVWG